MKNHTHIRIVCLKNESDSKRQHHQSGLIVPQSFKDQMGHQPTIVPSLAYLSARLQSNKQSAQSRVKEKHSQIQKNRSFFNAQAQTVQTKPLKDDSLPTIEKYVQGQKMLTANKKSTIRHMMGSIDFSLSNRRQKKIVKTLKQTIQGLSKTEALLDKKQISSLQKYNNAQNRIFLQQDFQNFLSNKNEQFDQKQLPKTDQENIKLHRLTVINPERQVLQTIQKDSYKLNLFNFQGQNQPSQKKSSTRAANTLQSPHISIAKARLQQKMFRMQLHLKNEQQTFEWSRVKSKKGYSFSTINH